MAGQFLQPTTSHLPPLISMYNSVLSMISICSLLEDAGEKGLALLLVDAHGPHCRRSRSGAAVESHMLAQSEAQSGVDEVPRTVVFVLLLHPGVLNVLAVRSNGLLECLMGEGCQLLDTDNRNILPRSLSTSFLSSVLRASRS